MSTKRRRLFDSVATRLIALGVLQLALIAATAIAIFIAEGPHDEARPDEHLPQAMGAIEQSIDQPEALQRVLDGLAQERIEVSIYDADRHLIASNVDPPLAIPRRRPRGPGGERLPPMPGDPEGRPPDDRGPPPFGPPRADGQKGRSVLIGIAIESKRGYLVARGVHAKPPGMTGPLVTLICGFVIVILGAWFAARWIVRPIDRLSRTARAFGAGDLHARSKLERSDEIGELGHRFDEMADRIEQLRVTEKELFANVAHELRTPLARIGVALDLAGEGDAEAARASLAEIAVDVAELESIVDDILTAMRFEIADGKATASLPMRRERIPAGELVEAACERFRARHASRTLEVELADGLPDVDADRRMLRRVIDNLLENAHKYTPDPALPVVLAAKRDGDRVIFEVRDRGIGIAADDLPRVFTAFFRGDRSRSRETGGVGLGLTLARRITEAHGGTIELASRVGEGTTARVAVPVA